ncbi:MAG: helix-turn-helix transcriptional regulator [Deltaproteobacteria bacterium]|nr:helix-turn-helix transcriptional regulator [Deltaproteobacteria bacterium]
MATQHGQISDVKVLRMVEVLKGVSHPLRLRIIIMLCRNDRDVTQMVDALGVRQSLVSQHLAHLRLTGLVSVDRSGGRATYSLKEPLLRDLVKCLNKCGEK